MQRPSQDYPEDDLHTKLTRPIRCFDCLKPALALLLVMVIGCNPKIADSLDHRIEAEIVGDSMAPEFLGHHSKTDCSACHLSWPHGERTKVSATVWCPNCGTEVHDAATVKRGPDRVFIDPDATVNRFATVAFERDNRTFVKRVVGLPGETIDFDHGDLVVNGTIYAGEDYMAAIPRLPVLTMKKVGTVGVFPPVFVLKGMFIEEHVHAGGGVWVFEKNHIAHQSALDSLSGQPMDSLIFRPGNFFAGGQGFADEVRDHFGFNQSTTRPLFPVDDLSVAASIELEPGRDARLSFDRQFRVGRFRVDLVFRSKTKLLTVRVSGDTDDVTALASTVGERKVAIDGNQFHVQIDNFNGLVEVAIDGKSLFQLPQRSISGEENRPPSWRGPLRISAGRGSALKINDICVQRDLYFFQANAAGPYQLPLTLKEDEFYVVGDNLAVSNDSRNFGPVNKILGVVAPN